MIEVGVRQLKNSLTRYLRLVEKGQSVLVTNRNRPVAVLRKPDRNSARTKEDLHAPGLVHRTITQNPCVALQ